MKRVIFAAALAAATLSAGSALAVPVNWTITGTWSDGGVINGTFTYDADTNTYSAINITTSGGALPSATYVAPNGVFFGSTQLVALTAGGSGAGQRVANFTFTGPLTNAGGTQLLGPATGEGTCNAGCSFYNSGVPDRTIVGGSVTTAVAAVPTMGEWAMIGLAGLLAVFGVGTVAQRQRRFVRA